MTKEKDGKKRKWIIMSVSLLIAIGLIAGYFYYHSHLNSRNHRPNFPGGNFSRNQTPLSEETKNEITSFFGNSPSSSEIQDYCSKNPQYCFYYCRATEQNNSNIDFCKQLKNPPYLNRSNRSS